MYQKAFLLSELKEIFSLLTSRRVGGGTVANEQVRKSYAELKAGSSPASQEQEQDPKRRALEEEDGDCPICFDNMLGTGQVLTFCRAACGTNFHADCIRRWKGQQRQATCPNCRQPWVEEGSSNTTGAPGTPVEEGYVNLGRLQGQSPVRDTSTYRTSKWASRNFGGWS
jgi:hypothetical protein